MLKQKKKKDNKSYNTFVKVHDLMGRLGFPGGPSGREPACSAGDWSLIPGLGRSLGGGNGSPLQYSQGQRSLEGYSPWGHKET